MWEPSPTPETSEEKAAYRAGRKASRRTKTYDLGAAEDRWIARNGRAHAAWFGLGWVDEACR